VFALNHTEVVCRTVYKVAVVQNEGVARFGAPVSEGKWQPQTTTEMVTLRDRNLVMSITTGSSQCSWLPRYCRPCARSLSFGCVVSCWE
jgi:hypothetical protein